MSKRSISVVIADYQPIFREGIKSLLLERDEFDVIYEAGNTAELLRGLHLGPDILILDFNPAYFDGARLAEALSVIPGCKVIIISSQDKKWNIFKSLEFNVYSYLTKECSIQEIIKAVQMASNGEKFFCSFIIDILLKHNLVYEPKNHALPWCLSERETEIVKLIAQGKINKEIARELFLSPHTVHTHRKNIMKKLGVHSAVELTNFAKENGLLA